MKPIHVYTAYSDTISASLKKIRLSKFMPGVNLRHTLKDGIPQMYWFTIETPEYWFDVDIRAIPGYDESIPAPTLYDVKAIIHKNLAEFLPTLLALQGFLLLQANTHPEHFTAERKR